MEQIIDLGLEERVVKMLEFILNSTQLEPNPDQSISMETLALPTMDYIMVLRQSLRELSKQPEHLEHMRSFCKKRFDVFLDLKERVIRTPKGYISF